MKADASFRSPRATGHRLVSAFERRVQRPAVGAKKRDLHESSLSHLKKAEETYTEMARYFPKQFTLIDCAPEGKLLPVGEISEKIWKVVQKKLK